MAKRDRVRMAQAAVANACQQLGSLDRGQLEEVAQLLDETGTTYSDAIYFRAIRDALPFTGIAKSGISMTRIGEQGQPV